LKHLQRLHGTARLRLISLAAWVFIPLLVTVIYLPGLHGPFVFDDLINIVTNPAVSKPSLSPGWFGEILRSGMAGPLGRPLAYLSFGFNYSVAGGFDNIWVFKLTNLIIHIVCSLLVWHFINLVITHLIRTTRIQDTNMVRAVPLLSAILFAVHPIQLTSVLYVVQRMTSLSALFVLSGLIVFFRGRLILPSRQAHGFLFMGAGLVVGLLGLASKENAILIVPLAMAIEYIVFTRHQLPTQVRGRLRLFYLSTAGVPLFTALLWLALDPSFLLNTYVTRDFGPIERLFTEARVLWFYVYLLAVPRVSAFGLFHDDIGISRTLFEPATTFFAVAAIVILVTVAVRQRHRYPVLSLAVIWFFVGHALESGVFGLELAHEHRNYLPSLGFMLLASYGIVIVAAKLTRPAVTAVIVIGLVAILGVTTFARAANWSDERRLIYHTVENHPRSPSAQYMFGEYLLGRASDPQTAIEHFVIASRLHPTEPAYLMAMQRAASAFFLVSPDNRSTGSGTASIGNINIGRASTAHPDISSYFQQWSDQKKRIRFLLHPGISQQVSQLLSNNPANPTAILQFNALLDCVANSPALCDYIARDAASWTLAAANNASLAPVIRHNLLVRLADMQISEKDYRAALRSALVGIAHAPHDATYRIMAADMLLFLERCGEAQSQLKLVLEDEAVPRDEKSTARELLQKVQQHAPCRNGSTSETMPANSVN